MPWGRVRAVNYVRLHAKAKSQRRCAEYVRRAIESGGIRLTRTASAKNYGTSLEAAGFYRVNDAPRHGDVVVIEAIVGHEDGHMAMYDGLYWFSDFKQPYGLYPGSAYREHKPPYKIYRHD